MAAAPQALATLYKIASMHITQATLDYAERDARHRTITAHHSASLGRLRQIYCLAEAIKHEAPSRFVNQIFKGGAADFIQAIHEHQSTIYICKTLP